MLWKVSKDRTVTNLWLILSSYSRTLILLNAYTYCKCRYRLCVYNKGLYTYCRISVKMFPTTDLKTNIKIHLK